MIILIKIITYVPLFLLVMIILAVIRIVRIQFAYDKHKEALRGTPILARTWALGGHMNQVFFKNYNCYNIETLHRLHGKTFGFMYGPKPMASTVDLDLIKRLVLDGPVINVNRANLSLPARDIQGHSILFAQGEHWRRLRKAIAHGFT